MEPTSFNFLLNPHRLFISLAIFLSSLVAFCQEGWEDVVYLKNGSIIHGMVIEQRPNESIKIKTYDGNIFVYRMDEVEKITKEEGAQRSAATPKRGTTKKVDADRDEPEGAQGSTASDVVLLLSADASGYGFGSRRWLPSKGRSQFGFGISYDSYSDARFLPFYLCFRAPLAEGRTVPYFNGSLGYALGQVAYLDGWSNGGLMFEPGLSIAVPIGGRSHFDIGAGYRVQLYKQIAVEETSFFGIEQLYVENTGRGSFAIHLGVNF